MIRFKKILGNIHQKMSMVNDFFLRVDKEPFVRHLFESRILREFFDFSMKERDILKRRYGIA
jgi:hypothetical protein